MVNIEIEISGKNCKLSALIDTGSLVSLVRRDIYDKWIKSDNVKLNKINRKLSNLSDPLKIVGVANIEIELEPLPKTKFAIDLFVIEESPEVLILGREFLRRQKLTLVFSPSCQNECERVKMFALLPSCYVDNSEASDELEKKIDNSLIDFGEMNTETI